MTYDWESKASKAYNRKVAGRGGGSAALNYPVPKGLRFSFDFYVRWAYDCIENMCLFAQDAEQQCVAETLKDEFVTIGTLRKCLAPYQVSPKYNEDQEELF